MAFSSYDICSKNLTKSHRHPYGIRLDGERKRWEKLKKIRNTCCAGIADKGLFYCASIINILLQKDVT